MNYYKDGFKRNFNLQVKLINKKIIAVKCTMLDLDHCISVTLKINKNTREIIDASAKMLKIPHDLICQKALDNIKSIIGIKIERGGGLSKKFHELLGGACGCIYINKSAWLAADMASNFIGRFESEEKQLEFLKNACVAYKE